MSFLKNISHTNEVEESKDVLGGGGSFTIPSGIYEATIKMAYGVVAESGANGVYIEFETAQGKVETTEWVTNRNGETFFVKSDKKFSLPGFTLVNNICLITTGQDLLSQETEEKLVEVYDFESKKRIPKNREVLTGLIGQELSIGVLEITKNKEKKVGNKYEPVNEKRTVNEIHTVWDTESQLTVYEASNELPATFYSEWKEKYQGVHQDRYKEVSESGQAGTGNAQAKAKKFGFAKK